MDGIRSRSDKEPQGAEGRMGSQDKLGSGIPSVYVWVAFRGIQTFVLCVREQVGRQYMPERMGTAEGCVEGALCPVGAFE